VSAIGQSYGREPEISRFIFGTVRAGRAIGLLEALGLRVQWTDQLRFAHVGGSRRVA
jgi:hypothetical protein